MKSLRIILLFFLALLIAGKVNAQMSVIIFSEKGEKFIAFVNNTRINDTPEARIAAERPGGPNFKVRISFEDTSIPEIQKTIFNTPESEIYYVIKGSTKGRTAATQPDTTAEVSGYPKVIVDKALPERLVFILSP